MGEEKQVMVVGLDESEQSFYALQWTLDKFFLPYAPNYPFRLILIHVKPPPTSAIAMAGPAALEVASFVQEEEKRITTMITEKVENLCISKSVNDVTVGIMEGDPRDALCEAVEKHHASVLVVGSHGYGLIKRAVLGSVSDYCAHHAHCSVLIVKRPKIGH